MLLEVLCTIVVIGVDVMTVVLEIVMVSIDVEDFKVELTGETTVDDVLTVVVLEIVMVSVDVVEADVIVSVKVEKAEVELADGAMTSLVVWPVGTGVTVSVVST